MARANDNIVAALDDADTGGAITTVVMWLMRQPDYMRHDLIECILAKLDKETRDYIGEIFFDIDH